MPEFERPTNVEELTHSLSLSKPEVPVLKTRPLRVMADFMTFSPIRNRVIIMTKQIDIGAELEYPKGQETHFGDTYTTETTEVRREANRVMGAPGLLVAYTTKYTPENPSLTSYIPQEKVGLNGMDKHGQAVGLEVLRYASTVRSETVDVFTLKQGISSVKDFMKNDFREGDIDVASNLPMAETVFVGRLGISGRKQRKLARALKIQ